MKVVDHTSPESFLAAAEAELSVHAVINQLPLAIARTAGRAPKSYPEGVRCATAHAVAGGSFAGAAVQTPPWPVMLGETTDAAAAALARHVFAIWAPQAHVPGVVGPDASVRAFGVAWEALSGASAPVDQRMGVFELTAVLPVPRAPGTLAVADASAGHAAILQGWLEAFYAEAEPTAPPPSVGAGERAVTAGRVYLWCTPEGQPVSFAMNSRFEGGYASIGPVYTPPELRGHGYATSLVADLSALLLPRGRGCTLFTNLANPTSNAIYERIGYARVGTQLRLRFTPPDAPELRVAP